ncbi:MAG: hypothetical protein U5N85_19835 [Arcicella sp.]|nr:hypothetical protein [Arcicella sp.]
MKYEITKIVMQAYYFVKIFRICFDLFGVGGFITKFIVDYLVTQNNEKDTISAYWLFRYYLQHSMLAHLHDTRATTFFPQKLNKNYPFDFDTKFGEMNIKSFDNTILNSLLGSIQLIKYP